LEEESRNECNFYYLLKSDEIRTLKEFSNAAYIFVFILPIGFSIENTYAFCIHSSEIDNMIEKSVVGTDHHTLFSRSTD